MKRPIVRSKAASLALVVALALVHLGNHQTRAEGLGLGNLLGEFGSTLNSLTTSMLGGTGGITSIVSGASSPIFGLLGSMSENLSANNGAPSAAVVSGPGAALGPAGAAYSGAAYPQAAVGGNPAAAAAAAAAAQGALIAQQQQQLGSPLLNVAAAGGLGPHTLKKRQVAGAVASNLLGGVGSSVGSVGSSVGGVASGALNMVGSTLNGLGSALVGGPQVAPAYYGPAYPQNNYAAGAAYGAPLGRRFKKREAPFPGPLGAGVGGLASGLLGAASSPVGGALNAVGSTLNGFGSALSGNGAFGNFIQAAGAGALANARDQRAGAAEELAAAGPLGGFGQAAGAALNSGAFGPGLANGPAGGLLGNAMGALGGAANALGAGLTSSANAGVAAVTGAAAGAENVLQGALGPASAAAAAAPLAAANAGLAPILGAPLAAPAPLGAPAMLAAPVAPAAFVAPAGPGAFVAPAPPSPQQQLARNALAASAINNAQAEAAQAGADMAAHGANNAHSASLASNAYRQAKLASARDRVNIAGTIQNSARISDGAIATHDAATKAEDSLLGSELAVDSAATVLDSDAAYIPPVTSSLLRSLPYGRLGVRNILPKPLTYPSILLPDVWLNGSPVNYLNVPLRMLPYGVGPTALTNPLWQSGANLAASSPLGPMINGQPFLANNGRYQNNLVFDPSIAYLHSRLTTNTANQFANGNPALVAPLLANGQLEAQDELGLANQVTMQQLAGAGMAATYSGYGRTNSVPMLTGSVSDINLMPTTTIGTTYPIGSALVIEPRDSYFQNYIDSASSRQNFDEKQQ